MQTFKDARRREWSIDLDDAGRDRVAAHAKVDGTLPIEKMLHEVARKNTAVDLLWAAIRPEFEAVGMGFDDFARRVLRKPKMQDAALKAVSREMARTAKDRRLIENHYAS